MYRAALATSHRGVRQGEVLDGLQNVLDPTWSSRWQRDGHPHLANLALMPSRWPKTCIHSGHRPARPYGNAPDPGIEFADGTRFAWVVFVGRIQDTTLNDDGICTVRGRDFAADVLRTGSSAGETRRNTVTDETVRLITEGFAQAQFGQMDIFSQPVRTRTWQLDRGQALDEITTSVGAFWYPVADGRFTLRRYPWTVAGTPVVTYSDAETYGSVSGSRASRSRSDVYNSLTVTGERLNGDPAVYALAQDTNPASTTYIDGNFGRRHQMLRLQTPGSVGAAQAPTKLKRLIGLVDA
jgi:hypothetical protein